MSDENDHGIDDFLAATGIDPTVDEKEPLWRREWVGMPEFVQERKEAYAKVVVRFRSQEDVEAFSRLIGQTVTRDSRGIWFPALEKGPNRTVGMIGSKKYVDEP